jgi:hypothetical protein
MLDVEPSIATAKISLIPTEALISNPEPSEKAYTARTKKLTATLTIWHQ